MSEAVPQQWPEPELNAFQEFLERERARLDIPIAELARRSGLKPQTLWRIMRDPKAEAPKEEQLRKLAHGLGTSLEFLQEAVARYKFGWRFFAVEDERERRLILSSRALEPHELDAIQAAVDALLRRKTE